MIKTDKLKHLNLQKPTKELIFSALMLLIGRHKGHLVICMGRDADLHTAQLIHCHSLSLAFVNPAEFQLYGSGSHG